MAVGSGVDHYYAVIMAGGGGTRLWPLSRRERPKQSLRLLGEQTMFETAVDRVAPLFSPERILVVTSDRYAADLQQQCPQLPPANYILEPAPRGTAPAIALAAQALRHRDPQAVMACLTADHYIGNEARFKQLLLAARQLAEQNFLVTLGIAPKSPATGFGYIQRGAALGEFGGFEAFRAERFKEKPAAAEAAAMLADGLHSWNSGMFVWRLARIWAEFERQMPELAAVVQDFEHATQTGRAAVDWERVPNTTIDYGIMEGAHDVAVIPADGLEWSDIGTWEALLDVLDRDTAGNVVVGADHVSLDTSDTLIHTVRGSSRKRLIATVGVSDLVIVDTDDVLLVCRRDRSQEVKALVDHLKQTKNGQDYL
jgi:mannose-1-phosphate guanylyltransferase